MTCWEKAKEIEFIDSVKDNILSKLNLCQKLKKYFEEDKESHKLDSLEYSTTSLMISAKIFENEENIKTFKRHEKICQTPMNILKKIELHIMNIKKWNLEHFCVYDFAMFIFTQKIFSYDDLIISDNNSLSLNEIIKIKFGVANKNFLKKIDQELLNMNLSNQIIFFGQFSKSKQKILNDFKLYFFETLKNLYTNYVFKSDMKYFLMIIFCVFIKEFLFGADYFVFFQFVRKSFELVHRYLFFNLQTNWIFN